MNSWVVVSICGDNAENGPNLHQIQAAIIPAGMLTPAVKQRAEAGEFLSALECQPTWTVVPAPTK
ncbi:hypothetical protein JT358_10860 [Micrococcales bacterium 31B]|nr:hypothetical protein [Micrococcales bacterium 31B]